MTANDSKPRSRFGGTHPLVIVLLAGILVTLVSLLVVVLSGERPNNGPNGQNPPPVEPPEPINNPERIQEIVQEGKTYDILLKGGFDTRVEDKDWGVRQVINLAFAFEMPLTRTIESNDGRTIVELRQFGMVQTVKLLTEVESVRIELGPIGTAALAGLEFISPGSGISVLGAKHLAEQILRVGAQYVTDQNSKAFGAVDSLSGKKVRITYVDGVGVTSVEPVDCQLTSEEHDYVMATAVLADFYAMPDVEIAEGASWTVDGGQLGGYLDPSLRGVSSGDVVVARGADRHDGGKRLAELSIQRGYLEINASDASRRRIGGFEPRGTLTYNLDDGYVQSAELTGAMRFEEVSTDHILFEARFFAQPNLQIRYSCVMR